MSYDDTPVEIKLMFSDNFDNWDDYINYRRADATVSKQPPTVGITMKFLQGSCSHSGEFLDILLPVVKSNPFWRLYFQAIGLDFPYLNDTSELVNRKCLDDALTKSVRLLTYCTNIEDSGKLYRPSLASPKNKDSVLLFKNFVDNSGYTNIHDFWSFLNCNVLDSIQCDSRSNPQVVTFHHDTTEEFVLKIMERFRNLKDCSTEGPLSTFLVDCVLPFIQRVLEFDFVDGNEDVWKDEFASRWNPEINFFISFFDTVKAYKI